ncbi:hypothetical protein D9M72_517830 [compost metagenome]
MARREGDAGAAADDQQLAVEPNRCLRIGDKTGRKPTGFGLAAIAEDDCELVAAEPCHSTVGSGAVPETLGHGDQNSVACRMTIAVVDRLERVEVGIDERERVRLCLQQRRCQHVVETAAIEQPRQPIVLGEMPVERLALLQGGKERREAEGNERHQ